MGKYIKVNNFLGVDSKLLSNKGIHNGFLLSDSNFYVDPEKLDKCNVPEFKGCLNLIYTRIKQVLTLLKGSDEENDDNWNAAYRMFTFEEPKFVALGLGIGTIEGKGLSGETAKSCLRKIKKLVDKGYNDPEIIYALAIFNDNVGTDKTSDLLCNILEENILSYTSRVLKELDVECINTYNLSSKFSKSKQINVLFRDKDKKIPLALLPKEILSPIPRIVDKHDICFAINENEHCKKYLSEILSVSVSKFYEESSKNDLFEFCYKYNLLENALKSMKNRKVPDYDESFEANYDEFVREFWVYGSDKIEKLTNMSSVYEITKKFLEHFKHIVENTYANSFDMTKAQERHFQFIFMMILETVKHTLNISVNYESRKSTGQIEFMIERGCDAVPVEFKLSSNNLVKGYNKQLKAYKKAGLHNKAFYVILLNNNKSLESFYKNITMDKNIEIIVIDCHKKTAPSK